MRFTITIKNQKPINEVVMPMYEYECETCKKSFEKIVFGTDTEPVVCPECGSKKVKRLLSTTSFIASSGSTACSPAASNKFS